MSAQLDHFLQLRADGVTMMTAAMQAGIGIVEARLTENDIAKGFITLPSPNAEERGDLSAPIPPIEKDQTMARKAKAANDDVEVVEKPDFERAAKILIGDIKPAEEQNAKSRGDLAAAWKVIADECHVNKKAAKDAFRLRQMSEELRDDYLRSLYGLMKEFHIGISADLVDAMGSGEAPTMPTTEEKAVETEDLAALQAAE